MEGEDEEAFITHVHNNVEKTETEGGFLDKSHCLFYMEMLSLPHSFSWYLLYFFKYHITAALLHCLEHKFCEFFIGQ